MIFCLGIVAGFFAHNLAMFRPTSDASGGVIRQGGYQFINPLLDYAPPESAFQELKPFKDKIATFVNQANDNSDHIDFVAVYFRDLNNGPWFGVNESATFAPASLLKVPLMMAYYKLADTDPSILQQTVTVTQENLQPLVPNQQTIVPAQRLVVGQTYTIDDLINRMIIYSDNDAAQLLIAHIDTGKLAQIYEDFGINLPGPNQNDTDVNVITYAGFFRMLFNASYLNKQDSEKALRLLSESDFNDGIVAGVPDGLTVSHKFGERVKDDGSMQLHDCGIVYYPAHPYLLCIMTRGDNEAELAKLVANTSQLVYQQVDQQYSKK